MARARFEGRIAGLGSESGVRVVVGRWDRSPFGAFSDVMIAQADGTRVLLAPTRLIADFVSDTYTFDELQVVPVDITGTSRWEVRAGELDLWLQLGFRTRLGWLLHTVPRGLATAPDWTRFTDPIARLALRGVRTRGTARPGRVETYGATDLHRISAAGGHWRGSPLGALRPLWPEPGFGFGSTPPDPSVTTLVTTVVDSA